MALTREEGDLAPKLSFLFWFLKLKPYSWRCTWSSPSGVLRPASEPPHLPTRGERVIMRDTPSSLWGLLRSETPERQSEYNHNNRQQRNLQCRILRYHCLHNRTDQRRGVLRRAGEAPREGRLWLGWRRVWPESSISIRRWFAALPE